MKVYTPLVFARLLEAHKKLDVTKSLNPVKNINQIKKITRSTGGKGGSFFFMSYDNKFLVKSISK